MGSDLDMTQSLQEITHLRFRQAKPTIWACLTPNWKKTLNSHHLMLVGLKRWKIYCRSKLSAPATDTLPSQACKSLSSSSGDLHSHKVDIKCLDKSLLYLIGLKLSLDLCGVRTDDRWTADGKLSASGDRNSLGSPKAIMLFFLLKLRTDSDKS